MKKYKWIVIAVSTISLISGCGKSTEKQISEQLEAGNKYLIEGNYEAAVVAFNKVIEIDPKIFEAYKKCAESYKEMDDFQNAIAAMENGVDVIGEDNLSEEYISFWKELYYSSTISFVKENVNMSLDKVKKKLNRLWIYKVKTERSEIHGSKYV